MKICPEAQTWSVLSPLKGVMPEMTRALRQQMAIKVVLGHYFGSSPEEYQRTVPEPCGSYS
jgi:hypothetical protein